MIAPHELKNKTFTKSVRGYTPTDVDEYFDFLIDIYTELYKANAELEKKFHVITQKYQELSGDEETIRSAILKAQKLGEVIINNAKDEAEKIIAGVRERCNDIVDSSRQLIDEEKRKMTELKLVASSFQNKLFDDYISHIEKIKEMRIEITAEEELFLKQEKQLNDIQNENETIKHSEEAEAIKAPLEEYEDAIPKSSFPLRKKITQETDPQTVEGMLYGEDEETEK